MWTSLFRAHCVKSSGDLLPYDILSFCSTVMMGRVETRYDSKVDTLQLHVICIKPVCSSYLKWLQYLYVRALVLVP